MRYGAAFERLGYRLANTRQSWSAAKADGVCLALRKQQFGLNNGLPYYDFFEIHPDRKSHMDRFGHRERTTHIARALREHDGRVDVVMVSAASREGAGDSTIWDVNARGGFWKITKFDPEDGYFRAEVVKNQSPGPGNSIER